MIKIIKSTIELEEFVSSAQQNRKTIGFAPTMGALHTGHCTLAERASRENDIAIVSIFVNPTQFNDKSDLEKYSRDLEGDTAKLAETGISAIFAPSVDDIYPHGISHDSDIELGGLDAFMEGPSRPGHFKGMAQVVKRLLDLVKPDKLYMGQKDFQQFTIVNFFIKNLKIPTKLVVCPIIREDNGLAMSSRNERLSKQTRDRAGIIYRTLKLIKRYKNQKTIGELIVYGIKRINKVHPFEVEYISIVDGNTLRPISHLSESNYIVVCIVVRAEGVRLLDNEILIQIKKLNSN
jgi:pantoate--beta-alanine ligase